MRNIIKELDHFIYIGFVVFYLWMAAQIPYAHDDWDWGADIGLHQLIYATLNSRYVGNFFEIIMTRSELLKTLIMGACFFFLPYLISRVVVKQESQFQMVIYLAANFFLLTMSRNMWSQTYGWVAGFSNFVLSAVLMILCLLRVKWNLAFEVNNRSGTIVLAAACFFLALSTQLFIENLSIYLSVVTLAACIVSYIKYRRVSVECVLMMLGSITGLVIMFSSQIYVGLWEDGLAIGECRQLYITSSGGILEKGKNIIIQCGRLAANSAESHPVLLIIVLVLLAVKAKKDNTVVKKLERRVLWGINSVLGAFFALLGMLEIFDLQDQLLVSISSAGAYVAFYFFVAYETFRIYEHKKRDRMLLLWLQIPAILLPLVVTSEAGKRVFFTSNVFIVVFALQVLYDILRAQKQVYIKKMYSASILITAIPVAILLCVYSAIGMCKYQRARIIDSSTHKNVSVVVLPQYPCEQYLHYPDPNEFWRWEYFKQFYGIADEVEVIIGDTASEEHG